MTIKRFEFNMFPVNCYVLSDETGEAAVIDAGCYYPNEQQRLKQYIIENQLTVKHLLNTHLHLDHVFGNPFMLREFNLRAEASREDEFLLDRLPAQCHAFGFPPNETPVPLGGYIADGDIIRFGNTGLKAIHVPGHSPGGIVYYDEAHQCAFSGDVLFRGSVGRADLEGGDFGELMDGIVTKLFTLPDDTVVYPGHGDSTTIGREKIDNPYFR